MDLVLSNQEVMLGDDFELNLEFTNRSNERRIVDAYISGSVVFYTGVSSGEFLFRSPIVTIGPRKSESTVLSRTSITAKTGEMEVFSDWKRSVQRVQCCIAHVLQVRGKWW